MRSILKIGKNTDQEKKTNGLMVQYSQNETPIDFDLTLPPILLNVKELFVTFALLIWFISIKQPLMNHLPVSTF